MNQADPLRIRLISDPGRPSAGLSRTEQELSQSLEHLFGIDVIVHRTEAVIVLDENELVDLGTTIRTEIEDPEPSDIIIALTEMPRLAGNLPLIAEVNTAEQTAIVSLPSTGVIGARRRLGDLMILCIAALRPDLERRAALPAVPLRGHWDISESGVWRLRGPRVYGIARTVLGMVVTNAPWRLAPRLGKALALATATGAFGIFYTTVWGMSAALSVPRLALISVVAVLALTVWLVAGNRLWERPGQHGAVATEIYYNLSTLLTMLIAVMLLYVELFAVILVAGLFVIDPDYLESVIHQQATLDRYVDIAWLSASLGTVAGGLGAGFDANTDIDTVTHRGRERGRFASARATEEAPAGR